jgi:PIN domain nuclease of toxin-antitoxin system
MALSLPENGVGESDVNPTTAGLVVQGPALDDDLTLAAAIRDPATDVLVSAASVWEAAIKAAWGKLALDGDLVEEIAGNGFTELAITARHAQLAGTLPRHHEDPFDRLLVAQARLEGLQLATHDDAFRPYGVALL